MEFNIQLLNYWSFCPKQKHWFYFYRTLGLFSCLGWICYLWGVSFRCMDQLLSLTVDTWSWNKEHKAITLLFPFPDVSLVFTEWVLNFVVVLSIWFSTTPHWNCRFSRIEVIDQWRNRDNAIQFRIHLYHPPILGQGRTTNRDGPSTWGQIWLLQLQLGALGILPMMARIPFQLGLLRVWMFSGCTSLLKLQMASWRKYIGWTKS